MPKGGDLVLDAGSIHTIPADSFTVDLRSGTRVLGEGAGATVSGGAYALFRFTGRSDVRFENLTLDVAAATNFRQWVSATDCTALRFHGITWRDTGGLAQHNWTNQGLLLQGCRDVLIEDCRSYGAQMKLAGPAGCSDVTVRRFEAWGALQYAVSFVIREPNARAENLLIEDFAIHDPPGNGGVYIGDDNATVTPGGVVRNIVIRNGLVDGIWPDGENTSAIHGRLAETSVDWTIENVKSLPSNMATNSTGIGIFPRDGGGTITNLLVENCEVRKADSWGIVFQGAGNAEISDCIVSDTRGVGVIGVNGSIGAVVHHDQISGGRYGIRVEDTAVVTYDHCTFTDLVEEAVTTKGVALAIDAGGNAGA